MTEKTFRLLVLYSLLALMEIALQTSGLIQHHGHIDTMKDAVDKYMQDEEEVG